jgi:hypothetical protein
MPPVDLRARVLQGRKDATISSSLLRVLAIADLRPMWRPSKLTPKQLEERQLAAVRLLRAGRLTQAEIARRVGR